MTDLLIRPLPSGSLPAGSSRRSLVLVAAASATWAAGIGLSVLTVVVLLAWSTDAASASGASVATHAAGHAWLLAHGIPLGVPGGRLGLVPLGAAVLPAALLWRAGVAVSRTAEVRDLAGVGRATGVLAAVYGTLAGVTAVLAATPIVSASPLRAMTGAGAFAVLAGGAGVLAQSGQVHRLVRRLPAAVSAVATAGVAGLLVLLCTGALLAGTSLGWHAGRVGWLAGALAPGTSAGIGLFAVDLALLPNAVVWAAGFAVGPGFAVGTGTAVTPFGVTLGATPALPLLAALPAAGRVPLAALPALLGPAVAGVVAGLVLVRRLPALGRRTAALYGAAGGAGGGLALGVAAWLAGGPAGPGRLGTVGPSPLAVGLAAGCELAVVAAGMAWWRSGPGRVSG